MIFQDFNIIENLTVLENVELALLRMDDVKERRRIAKELIGRVGLTKQMNQRGSKLSGGEKQRTVIARALAKDAPVILADEPTGNLDVKASKEVAALLKEVSKENRHRRHAQSRIFQAVRHAQGARVRRKNLRR